MPLNGPYGRMNGVIFTTQPPPLECSVFVILDVPDLSAIKHRRLKDNIQQYQVISPRLAERGTYWLLDLRQDCLGMREEVDTAPLVKGRG